MLPARLRHNQNSGEKHSLPIFVTFAPFCLNPLLRASNFIQGFNRQNFETLIRTANLQLVVFREDFLGH
jgi:hypothetical protein